jgi:hypothetical protein
VPTIRQRIGSYGGHVSWQRTVDRSARTAAGRRAGPNTVEYWLERLDPKFQGATEAECLAAAKSARSAHFALLALRSAQARRAKADQKKAS